MSAHALKERLMEELEKLSEERLKEVLDFVGFLRAKEQSQSSQLSNDLDPQKDPLLQFIGGVSHGSLAQGIDEELYGS